MLADFVLPRKDDIPELPRLSTMSSVANLKSIVIQTDSLEKDRRNVIKELQEARLKASQKRKMGSELLKHVQSVEQMKESKKLKLEEAGQQIHTSVLQGNSNLHESKASSQALKTVNEHTDIYKILEDDNKKDVTIEPARQQTIDSLHSTSHFPSISVEKPLKPVFKVPNLSLSLSKSTAPKSSVSNDSPRKMIKQAISPQTSPQKPLGQIENSILDTPTKPQAKIVPCTILDENGNLPDIQTEYAFFKCIVFIY